ncbi:RWD domain-containing protein 3 isoform X2 [Lethenteron reissneri]|uniref:RWD domain-containing protein 3 isoform X2 n=1 Tax=Lethenteron reissneri TaxID=7753 RepID=UPI002AB7DC55|nr:RWD domain-containing protein 3 isoform X2 [Lethenteron reissneri]
MSAARDEVAVLEAIYCAGGELEVRERSGNYRTLSSHPWMKASPCPFGRGASLTMLHCAVTNGITLALNICCESRGVRYPLRTLIRLPPGYPTQQHLDVVSLHVDGAASPAVLTREQCRTLLHNIRQQAFALPPQPAVHDLALWLQQNFETLLHVGGVTITAEQEQYAKHLCSEAASPGTKDGNISAKDLEVKGTVALLRLDHMRARARYTRTIEGWVAKLGLMGRLLFYNKLILVLLQGSLCSIREYIVLQKTSKVDVDSSGKRCKEKMMSVLWEGTMSTRQYRFSDFCVLEISSTNELGKVFEEAQLGELYHQCVVPTLP